MKALLHFRNLDSTLDLNQQMSGFIKRGIVSGGDILPIPGQLKVDVTAFKVMGFDGMVVLEESQATRLDVVAGRTNVIVLKSKYVANGDPVIEFQVLDLTSYNADTEKDYLCVFATITLSNVATEVVSTDISFQTRDEVDPLGRFAFRGHVESTGDMVTAHARPGDFYTISSGSGDVPAIWAFNGVDFVNITDSVVIASLLNAHRNNLFSNERHMSDAQADAAQGTSGTPSDTNRFVTASDVRLPSTDENDALSGLPSTPAPSAANPFVTAAYYIAQPSEISLAAGSSTNIQMFPVQGPFYVGTGGAASVKNFFKFYHVDAGGEPREFTDSVNGQPVTVNKIYKDAGLTQELVPASEAAVLLNGGFWTGSLYITYFGTLAHEASRLLYGKQTTLANLNKGLLLKPNPGSAQMSQEAILKDQEISGYKFDEVVSLPETNKELRKSVVELMRFLETGANTSHVVDAKMFAKLRETTFAADFPANYGEITVQTGNLSYAKIQSDTFDSAYTSFDAALNSGNTDMDYTALINFLTPATSIGNVKPGHLFTDQAGKKFRILAVNTTGNGSLIIFTGGQIVADFTVGGVSVGAIYADNNPRGLELLSDFQAGKTTETFLFEGIEESKEIDGLPLGGIPYGAVVSTSLLPKTVLPNMGAAVSVHKGRKIFKLLPKKQGNRHDQRINLVGTWTTDSDIANTIFASVGDSAAIDYTGKAKALKIWVDKNADLSGISAHVFVDGVYASTKTLTLPAYPHKDILGDGPKQFPIDIALLSDSNVHNVRIEFTGPVGIFLPVYGMEVSQKVGSGTQAFTLDAGRVHSHIALGKSDVPFSYTPDVSNYAAAKKVLAYFDPITQAVLTAETQSKDAYDNQNTAIIPQGSAIFSNVAIGPKAKIGDVMLFAKTDSVQITTEWDVKRIIDKNYSINEMTLEAPTTLPVGLDGSESLIRQLFTIPVDSAGAPKLQAMGVEDTKSQEYSRLKLADLSLGNALDLGDINPFSEDLVTVFADGATSIGVTQCQKTTSNISGYTEGIQFLNGSSRNTMQVWGTRADVVFAGTLGATNVQIFVDGIYTYTIALKGTGVERHTLFFDASLGYHTVSIRNASVPLNVVIAEWILFDLKTPTVSGVPLAETVYLGTNAIYPYDASLKDVLVRPLPGSCSVDLIKFGQISAQGTGGTKDWYYEVDVAQNPLSGYVLRTDRSNGEVTFQLPEGATSVYAYVKEGVTSGRIDTSSPLLTVTSGGLVTIKSGISGNFTLYGLSYVAEGMVQVRNLDDTKQNHLKFASFKDLRNYLSITADNVGVTQGSGEGTTVVAATEAGLGSSIEPAKGFEAVIWDEFSEFPNLPASTLNSTITNAVYNPETQTYRMLCDKTKTVTMIGASYTLNAAPTFELKQGDVIVVGGIARRIATVVTLTTGTVDSAFPSAVSGAACMVSQAVWTKDISAQGDATQATRPIDVFPATSITSCAISYEDSLALGDTTFDKSQAARVSVIAASEGLAGVSGTTLSSNYGPVQARSSILETYNPPAAANNQRLFVGFFCNPNEASVVSGANLLYFDVSFYDSVYDLAGGALHSAFVMSGGGSTPKNCTLSLSGGVTVLTLTNWTYTMGINDGETIADIDVLVDGKTISRDVSGVVPASETTWKEVTGRPDQIQFSANLVPANVSIEIRKARGSKDTSPLNRTLLANQLGLVVGSGAMVSAGAAAYATLQDAVNAASPDSVITVLNGTSLTETVTVNKRVYIQGKGYGSALIGNLNLGAGADYSTVKGLKFTTGTLTANGCQVLECFFTTQPTDSGIGNYVQGIEV